MLFEKTRSIFKLPLYLLFSVLLSTNLVYFLSLRFGFSSLTVFLSYLLWALCFIYMLVKKKFKPTIFNKKHLWGYVFAVLTFVIFIVSLYQSIFFKYQNYYVMSADNWQDTALHFSIMESLKEGNFPPIAPYYGGEDLAYHYFTDFHSAIWTKPLDKFTPRIFILDNSIFALIFAISIYSLSFYITKNRITSAFSLILALFSGSLLHVRLISDWLNGVGSIKELILSGSYVLEYGKLYQMAPMTNYFLQNRPMMVGMSSIAVSIYLFLSYLRDKNKVKLATLLIVSLLTFNFQMITSGIILILFCIALLIKNKKLILFSPLAIIPFLYIDTLKLFLKNLEFGSWISDQNLLFFVKFMFANLGVPFFLFVLLIFLFIFKRIKLTQNLKVITSIFLVLLAIPLVVSFTIDRADMLKFVYISYIPLSILAAIPLGRMFTKPIGKVIVPILLIGAILTGVVDLSGSFLNKNFGYSEQDLSVGLWIRDNTPQNSVFVGYPTIHSPISDIAGRIRVISYINWPYTHGYGTNNDNVFSRRDDVSKLYDNLDNKLEVESILSRYKAEYIYLGPEETSNFPQAENKIESNSLLKKIYDQEDIKIYQRVR